jgi:hypothetical protein
MNTHPAFGGNDDAVPLQVEWLYAFAGSACFANALGC